MLDAVVSWGWLELQGRLDVRVYAEKIQERQQDPEHIVRRAHNAFVLHRDAKAHLSYKLYVSGCTKITSTEESESNGARTAGHRKRQ